MPTLCLGDTALKRHRKGTCVQELTLNGGGEVKRNRTEQVNKMISDCVHALKEITG